MKIAVCDDEKNILEEVSSYIIEFAKNNDIEIQLHPFQNASDLETEIENNIRYDIAFFDIEMGDKNGIEIAKKMKYRNQTTQIIFITGYEQYVHDVFEAQPCGFVKKPIQKEKIKSAFYTALKYCDDYKTFVYSVNGKEQQIYLSNIFYITSNKKKIVMKTMKGDVEYYGKMYEVEQKLEKLDDNFIRINKYMIINMKYINKINYSTVTLAMNGKMEMFNISQTYRVEVRKKNKNRIWE